MGMEKKEALSTMRQWCEKLHSGPCCVVRSVCLIVANKRREMDSRSFADDELAALGDTTALFPCGPSDMRCLRTRLVLPAGCTTLYLIVYHEPICETSPQLHRDEATSITAVPIGYKASTFSASRTHPLQHKCTLGPLLQPVLETLGLDACRSNTSHTSVTAE